MKTMIRLAMVAILAAGCWNPFAVGPDPTPLRLRSRDLRRV